MQLPGPLRAMVGLVVTAADEAKNLPDRAIEVPMLAVSTALQASLRLQQRYARLAARGEEVLSRRTPSEQAPPWATFDEPIGADALRHIAQQDSGTEVRTDAAAAQLPTTGSTGGRPTPLPVTPHDSAKSRAGKRTATSLPAAKRTAAKRATSKATPGTPAATTNLDSGKTVNRPRHTQPSRFDSVDEE